MHYQHNVLLQPVCKSSGAQMDCFVIIMVYMFIFIRNYMVDRNAIPLDLRLPADLRFREQAKFTCFSHRGFWPAKKASPPKKKKEKKKTVIQSPSSLRRVSYFLNGRCDVTFWHIPSLPCHTLLVGWWKRDLVVDFIGEASLGLNPDFSVTWRGGDVPKNSNPLGLFFFMENSAYPLSVP